MVKKHNKVSGFLLKFPILTFFALAWVIGGWVVVLIAWGIIPSNLILVSVFSASIAGITMTALEDGNKGVKLIVKRLTIWKVGVGYWLFAFFFLVPVILLGSKVNPLFNGETFSFNKLNLTADIVPLFLIFFLVAGLGQELGWSGFLIPRLQARFSAFTSAVIRALLTGIWYLPMMIYVWLKPYELADIPYGSWILQKGFLLTYLTMIFMLILPWSIFYTWIFNNTRGSLLLVSILHGSEIWLAYWMMASGINPKIMNNYSGYAIIMVILSTFIVVFNGTKNLSRKYNRITTTRLDH